MRRVMGLTASTVGGGDALGGGSRNLTLKTWPEKTDQQRRGERRRSGGGDTTGRGEEEGRATATQGEQRRKDGRWRLGKRR
jgi:hypothetical protein